MKAFWIKPLLIIFGVSLSLTQTQAQNAGQKQTGPPQPVAVNKPGSIKVIEDASAPAGWKRYEFGEGLVISAILPGHPKEFTEQKSLGGEKLTTMHAFTSETEKAVYTAYYAEDLPFIAERMPEDFRNSFYKGMWLGLAKGMQQGMEEKGLLFKVTLLEQRSIIVENLKGVEQDFTLGPMQGRAQMALSGQRAFMVIALWAEDAPAGERTAFFNSFRVIAKR